MQDAFQTMIYKVTLTYVPRTFRAINTNSLHILRIRCGSGGGGGWGPAPPPTPHFEAQIFDVIATLLRDVGKILAGPPPYTNPGSTPAYSLRFIYSATPTCLFLHRHTNNSNHRLQWMREKCSKSQADKCFLNVKSQTLHDDETYWDNCEASLSNRYTSSCVFVYIVTRYI